MCVQKDDHALRNHTRHQGTWQFTAVRVLRDERLVPNRIDGVESFFHLLTWMALRYTAHAMDNTQLVISLRLNFDAFFRDVEGRRSATTLRTGGLWNFEDLIFKDARFGNEGIFVVLKRMFRVLLQRYTRPEERLCGVRSESNQRLQEFVRMEQTEKEMALQSLDDPRWLPDLLDKLLWDERIDWETNENRTEHELPDVQFLPNYYHFLC